MNQNRIFVMMGPSNTISSFDMKDGRIVDSIAVEGNPHGGALTPDGRYIYTSSMGSKSISVVDTQNQKVIKTIDVGAISHHAAVRPDGRYVYVAAGPLVIIDTNTNRIVKRIKTKEPTFYPVLSPDGQRLYVLSMGSTISVIDTKTNKRVDTFSVGTKAMMGHLAVAPDGETLYVTSDMVGLLSVIDAKSGQRRAAVPIGKRPHGVAVSEDGSRVFVGTRDRKAISVVDPKQAKVVATLKLSGYPEHLSMSGDGSYLFVGLKKESGNKSGMQDAAIVAIDPASLNIVKEISVWPEAHAILVPSGR